MSSQERLIYIVGKNCRLGDGYQVKNALDVSNMTKNNVYSENTKFMNKILITTRLSTHLTCFHSSYFLFYTFKPIDYRVQHNQIDQVNGVNLQSLIIYNQGSIPQREPANR